MCNFILKRFCSRSLSHFIVPHVFEIRSVQNKQLLNSYCTNNLSFNDKVRLKIPHNGVNFFSLKKTTTTSGWDSIKYVYFVCFSFIVFFKIDTLRNRKFIAYDCFKAKERKERTKINTHKCPFKGY